MKLQNTIALACLTLVVGVLSASGAWAQGLDATNSEPVYRIADSEPVYRVAERLTPRKITFEELTARRANEHPLMPAIRWAKAGLKDIETISDMSATMVKRERVNGQLGDRQYLFFKIRHQPLSVYTRFIDPPELRGQEAIWVKGQNDGKLLAHGTGMQRVFGTVELDPTGLVAMKGNRYPITEMGIHNLIRRLVDVAEHDAEYGECDVKFYPDTKINDRGSTCIEVVHPVPRKTFLFNVARIFVDDEMNLPVRYEAYDWPAQPSGRPVLTEEYTYLDVRLNNGFTDLDFDRNNPNYDFPGAKQ